TWSDETKRSSITSSAGASAISFSFTFLRYLLMNVFVRILKSQALMLVPFSNESKNRNAFRYVSWTRSSASLGLRVRRRALAYRASICSRARHSNSDLAFVVVVFLKPNMSYHPSCHRQL